ncbi:TadE/TadG family type IV pilus assembly protein [Altererythrobacter litoralis]|uniref:TadE/TadG family type IV pilus assembly protein n=1 Tax=Altererythrobacter litoralis TaxID=3113904 RepID=A0ABU7GBD2_9SPHN|nr:TadE/TadG family type IV pilus assembly protein [Erythrobacteraceae bacterium 1XM1-14]
MMARSTRTLAALRKDERGSMVIETAIVAPVLILMALGGFESSRIVARQTELQTAVAEAAAIVRASPPTTATQRTTVRDVVRASVGLEPDQVTVVQKFRCGTDEDIVAQDSSCTPGVAVYDYIEVVVTDTYTPTWTQFGVGSPINYRVERLVFIS